MYVNPLKPFLYLSKSLKHSTHDVKLCYPNIPHSHPNPITSWWHPINLWNCVRHPVTTFHIVSSLVLVFSVWVLQGGRHGARFHPPDWHGAPSPGRRQKKTNNAPYLFCIMIPWHGCNGIHQLDALPGEQDRCCHGQWIEHALDARQSATCWVVWVFFNKNNIINTVSLKINQTILLFQVWVAWFLDYLTQSKPCYHYNNK